MAPRTIWAAGAALMTLGLSSLVGARAGEWRLDPWLCPDLREDIADSRIDYGHRDRKEDRRDARRTICPASAWVYVPDRSDYRRDYRAPRRPRYSSLTFRNGSLYGLDRGGLYPVVTINVGSYGGYYGGRYDRRYDKRYDRYGHRYDRRWDQRWDRREDRRDRKSDRRDDRRDQRSDRRSDQRGPN